LLNINDKAVGFVNLVYNFRLRFEISKRPTRGFVQTRGLNLCSVLGNFSVNKFDGTPESGQSMIL
jgi:hypothetical protein